MAISDQLQGLLDTAFSKHDAAAQATQSAASADAAAKTANDAALQAYKDVVSQMATELGQQSQPSPAPTPAAAPQQQASQAGRPTPPRR